jgi:uncharacterized protein (UPF0212 family)
MFHRRRQRRQFREAIMAEVERVTPAINAAVNAASREITMTDLAVRDLPGAAAACSGCGTRMRVRRVKQGRQWWTLWVCPRCGKTIRPADIPAHRRLGGWRG